MWLLGILICVSELVAEFSVAELVTHEGGTVIASCYVSPAKYRITPVYWRKFHQYITSNYKVTLQTNLTDNLINRLSVIGENGHYNLKITNVTYEDAGDYSCGYYQTQNDWITREDENLFIHAPIPPEPGYPLCATEPADQLRPNMPVKLSCISRGGSPPPSLTWYRDDIPLQTSNPEFEGYHERILTPEDNGVRFVCKSTSPGFDSPKECSITPLRLIPEVRIYESHNPVKIGDDVEFKCAGKGIPSVVSYSWFWNEELITEDDSDRLIISGDYGEILTLSSADQNENGSLFRCDVETVNELRNTDQLRLKLLPNIVLPDITTKKMASFAPVIDTQNNDTRLSFGAVFGCILAGIAIALIVLGILKARSRYRKKHHREIDFNRISLNRLNNFRHQNVDELNRLNQTPNNNNHLNLGVIDHLAAATISGTDYDHINDNESRKELIQSNHKQIEEHKIGKQTEEHYANPDFKQNSQIDCQMYQNVDSASAKKHSSASNMDQINPLYASTAAVDLSAYEFPDHSPTTSPPRSKRMRSQSVANQVDACHYQSPSRRMMPNIREDSNKAPLRTRVMARSLPDLTPSLGLVSVPIDLGVGPHDYVNMATSPTSVSNAPDYHGYVNYTHDVSSMRNQVARSDSSSSGYCEELESPIFLPAVSPTKRLRYAELDFPEYSDLNDTTDGNSSSSTENILQYSQIPSSATDPISPPLISYSKIAYVFKDRRQQSEPSVQRTTSSTWSR